MIGIRGLCSCLVLSFLFAGGSALAAEPSTEHTFRLTDGETPPAASLADARWLVGSWSGTAFGQRFEQVWSPPSAGSMVGTFKLIGGEQVTFYEILLLSVEDGTLSLKVKHFNPDFTAWEEKAEFVDFRLVKFDDDELHFSGLSFYRRDNDNIDGYIVMRSDDELREQKLVYKRRD